MINTLNIGKAGAADQSTLASQVSKRANATHRGDAATSEFAKFLTDVLTKIDGTSSASSGSTAAVTLPSARLDAASRTVKADK